MGCVMAPNRQGKGSVLTPPPLPMRFFLLHKLCCPNFRSFAVCIAWIVVVVTRCLQVRCKVIKYAHFVMFTMVHSPV